MNSKYQAVQNRSFWKENLAEDIHTPHIAGVRNSSGEEMAMVIFTCGCEVKPHSKKPFAQALKPRALHMLLPELGLRRRLSPSLGSVRLSEAQLCVLSCGWRQRCSAAAAGKGRERNRV